MAFYFKRNTDIYISKAPEASANASNTVLLNVKDFSFNQGSSSVNVGRETLDPIQERTVAPYIATVAPVNFSLTTYILPLVDTNVTSPEEYLWVSLMGADSLTSNSTSSTIDFSNGNVSTLPNLTLWFDYSTETEGNYRLDNAIVDSATINFDLNGIAEITWQGRALSMVDDSTPPSATDRTTASNYLKNKLSTITMTVNAVGYTLALTGGSIEFNNNNRFYGRNKLGETTLPVGHHTGNRTITGNLDFYMKSGTNQSVDLFNTLLTNVSNNNYEEVYLADITVNIAGTTAPYVQLNVPQAILALGNQNFGDVLGVSIPFTAKEEASNYSTVIYNMP